MSLLIYICRGPGKWPKLYKGWAPVLKEQGFYSEKLYGIRKWPGGPRLGNNGFLTSGPLFLIG